MGSNLPSTRRGRFLKGSLLAATMLVACARGMGGGALPEVRAAAAAERPESFVRITFLDVGQADAVVVQAPTGQVAMIDAGQSAPIDDLRALGIERIDLLVASHPHADHIGGMEGVLESFPVHFYMDNGQPHTTATYRHLLETLDGREDITYLQAVPRTVRLGDVQVQVLPLPPAEVDHNERSVALVVRFGVFAAFLSGDSETGELSYLVRRGAVPDVMLLKAAHHGSANGFTRGFLEAADPEAIVVSVGRNSYGHPSPEAMTAYRRVAEHVYRTDRDGAVSVLGYADGRFDVVVGRAALREQVRAEDAPPGSALRERVRSAHGPPPRSGAWPEAPR